MAFPIPSYLSSTCKWCKQLLYSTLFIPMQSSLNSFTLYLFYLWTYFAVMSFIFWFLLCNRLVLFLLFPHYAPICLSSLSSQHCETPLLDIFCKRSITSASLHLHSQTSPSTSVFVSYSCVGIPWVTICFLITEVL